MKRILVAEDDPDYAGMLLALLEDAGYHVEHAPDGMEAHRLLSGGAFDLVILDLAMPGLSGLEVMRTVSRGGGRCPVLVLTGHDAPEVRREAEAAGIQRFLSKSADTDDILAAVREALGG